MRNIELKIVLDSDSKNGLGEVVEWIESILNAPLHYRTFKANESYREEIRAFVSKTYNASVSDGCLDGCYGSRTGNQSSGLTVWIHPKHLVDRYIDSEYGEQVNPWDLLNENGVQVEEFESDEEIERFLEHVEKLGISVKSDNTYNYATDYGGENSDCAGFMYDFQFDVIENEHNHRAPVYLAVMFHCGGDPRGNYTSKKIWKFDSIDEVYSVLHPSKMLSSDEE